jgi:hypothetical protein
MDQAQREAYVNADQVNNKGKAEKKKTKILAEKL